MPYKRVNPVSLEEMEQIPAPMSEMDRNRYKDHFTICQTLRDMYHETTDENIRYKCRLCVAMAKKMNQKLQDYKHVEEERQKVNGI